MSSKKDVLKNPFEGYLKKLEKRLKKSAVNPVHEIVNNYYILKKIHRKPKDFYRGRFAYGKLAREAKKLYLAQGEDLDASLSALYRMSYRARKKRFDWSISTCLKLR